MSDTERLNERLYWAVKNSNVNLVGSLLRLGVDPNDCLYWTKEWAWRKIRSPPLHTACENGYLDIVKMLILSKAYINRGGGWNNMTPLHYACQKGHKEVVRYLVEEAGCGVDMRDEAGQSPLDIALYNVYDIEGCVDVALYLINCCDSNKKSKVKLLYAACLWGKLDVVKGLVEQHKVEPGNLTDKQGKTPLDIAMKYSIDSASNEAVKRGCTEVAEYLISLQRSSAQLKAATSMFLKHPSNVKTKPGSSVKYSVAFSTPVKTYKWYFEEIPISSEGKDYRRSAANNLTIKKCLPKHKGAYKCVVTDEFGETFTSESAALVIDGETIRKEESKLLGELLRKAGVSLLGYGVDVNKLAEGNCDHTYEEIQYVLKDNPTTHVLSVDLKEELTTRLEEERLYKEAMVTDQKVSLSYTKILALGPGQVGKSTFLYRLMGLMKGNIQTASAETQPQCSTGVTELTQACITYSSRTGALTSKSWQVFDESSDLQRQLEGLMSLLVEQTPHRRPSSEAETNLEPSSSNNGDASVIQQNDKNNVVDFEKSHSEKKLYEDTHLEPVATNASNKLVSSFLSISKVPYQQPQLSIIDKVLAEFERIQAECKYAPSKTKFRMLFNVADIGGQPAFLEMLPSLTIGPALYLVFMKLLQGLTTQYPVAYKCKDEKGSKLCKNYTYTSEEVIFTALSSIACFGNSDDEVEQYVTHTSDKKQTNSLALLVGTFKDEMKDEKSLDDIDRELQQKLEVTDFFNDGLIHSKSFLRVDNFSAPKDEIEQHRNLLEEILDKKFHKFDIPARWLTLSICLKLLARKENRHEVPFDDCVKLGGRLGMSKEMVKVALQFLHKYIGLVMYFPKNIHLKNVVICNPQVVFSSISELIFDIYDPRKMYITEAQHDHFVQTGCFSPQEIKPIKKDKKFLPIETLVHLLAHLNIIAEVPSTLGAQEDSHNILSANESVAAKAMGTSKKYYFVPAVLQTAVLSRISRGANEEQLPEPLCIGFKTGYLPLGFVCALSAKLIGAENKFELIPFEVKTQQITYKNKIRFRFQGEFDILMMSGPKYCELHVTRCSEGAGEYWDSECCPRIKAIVCEAANQVIQSMHHGSLYKLAKSYELAFKCPNHSEAEIGHEPLATFVYDDSLGNLETALNSPKKILCTDSSCKISTPLSPEMKMWFGEAILSTPPKIIREPSALDGKIKIQAEGTKPLKYQWFKDNEELSDCGEYNKCTTSELVIVGTIPQLKGMYKCRVTNKCGEKFSQEKHFDPFVRELNLKGLRDGEISRLLDNGIETIEDLESLTENDIESLHFNIGEKKRVRNLLLSIQTDVSTQSSQSDHELVKDTAHELCPAALQDPPVVLTLATHLQRVKELIWEVRVHWNPLAGALGVPHDIVTEIRHDLHCRDDGDRLERVLTEWMSKGNATIQDLRRALINPTVNCGCIARKLCALFMEYEV